MSVQGALRVEAADGLALVLDEPMELIGPAGVVACLQFSVSCIDFDAFTLLGVSGDLGACRDGHLDGHGTPYGLFVTSKFDSK